MKILQYNSKCEINGAEYEDETEKLMQHLEAHDERPDHKIKPLHPSGKQKRLNHRLLGNITLRMSGGIIHMLQQPLDVMEHP